MLYSNLYSNSISQNRLERRNSLRINLNKAVHRMVTNNGIRFFYNENGRGYRYVFIWSVTYSADTINYCLFLFLFDRLFLLDRDQGSFDNNNSFVAS